MAKNQNVIIDPKGKRIMETEASKGKRVEVIPAPNGGYKIYEVIRKLIFSSEEET